MMWKTEAEMLLFYVYEIYKADGGNIFTFFYQSVNQIIFEKYVSEFDQYYFEQD